MTTTTSTSVKSVDLTSMPHSENLGWSDVRQRNLSSSTHSNRSKDASRTATAVRTDKEKSLLRKLDWRIVPWIFILYFLSVEDRANVGYAMTMNKQQGHDLATTAGLTARENNIGLGLFYVAYIVCIKQVQINKGLLINALLYEKNETGVRGAF